MARFIVRSFLSAVITMFLVSVFLYFLIEVGSGDVTIKIIGIEATPEKRESYRNQLGLNQSVYVRYLTWLTGNDWWVQQRMADPITTIKNPQTGEREWWSDVDGELLRWKMVDGERGNAQGGGDTYKTTKVVILCNDVNLLSIEIYRCTKEQMHTCPMRTQGLDPERKTQHRKSNICSTSPLRSSHAEVLHAHHHRGHQVDVAEGQRGRPDPELLGTCKGLVAAALGLHADKLLAACGLEAVSLFLVTLVALAYAISISGTRGVCFWSDIIVL